MEIKYLDDFFFCSFKNVNFPLMMFILFFIFADKILFVSQLELNFFS